MSGTTTPASGGLFDQLNDMTLNPGIMAMLGAAQGFGQAAMPQPYRGGVPMGAAIGLAAGGMGTAAHNAYANQVAQQDAIKERLGNIAASYQLPVTQAQDQWMLQMYQHPEVLQGLIGGSQTAAPNVAMPAVPGQPAAATPNATPGGTKVALGMGQNNPLNLEYRSDQPGAQPVQGNRFGAYATMADGVAANTRQLLLNQQQGINTVRGQVTKWVNDPHANLTGADPTKPGPTNAAGQPVDPGSYIGDVSHALGVGPDDPIDVTRPNVASAFITAAQPHESGPTRIAAADVNTGVQKAFGMPVAAASSSGNVTPGDAMTTALQYEARANQMEMISKLPGPMQLPMLANMGLRYEDPAVLRQAAQQYRTLALAGPTAAATQQGKAQNDLITDRFGNLYTMGPDHNWQYLGRGAEVKPVYDPAAQKIVYGDVGGQGLGAQTPPGGPAPRLEAPNIPEATAREGLGVQGRAGIISPMPGAAGAPAAGGSVGPSIHIAPGRTETPMPGGGTALTDTRAQQGEAYQKDLEELHADAESLQHLQQSQSRVLAMRDLAHELTQTGGAGNFRADVATWLETVAPSMRDGWLEHTANLPPADIAAEFNKLGLLTAGQQEREAVGARGGAFLTNLYRNANPNLNMVPNANIEISNLNAVAHQMDLDYLRGEQQWGADKGGAYLQGKADYEPITQYDAQWNQQRNPQTYLAATYAMSGRPFDQWSKGLSKDEIGRALSVVRRIDPTTPIMWNDGKPHQFAQQQ